VPPAGDQDKAPGGTRQQRADLIGASRVVQHDEHPLAGQVITPQPGARLQAAWHLLGCHSGGLKQAGQRLGGIDGPLARGMAVQRQEDLTVWEQTSKTVRGVNRERRLANPGHPAHRVDTDRAPHPCDLRRRLDQLPEFIFAACKQGDVARQRPGSRRETADRAWNRPAALARTPPGSRFERLPLRTGKM
jgi:hypothetical protein